MACVLEDDTESTLPLPLYTFMHILIKINKKLDFRGFLGGLL